MKKVFTWLKGKKTYITTAIIAIIGGLQAIGIATPEWVLIALGALGLGCVRSAIHNETHEE